MSSKWFLKLIISYLAFMSINILNFDVDAHADADCSYAGSKNKVYMDQVNDPAGFCGTFAFRALLYQASCSQDEKSCFLPSILDILKVDAKSGHQHRTAQDLYPELEKSGLKLADEGCLNFSSFFSRPLAHDIAPQTFESSFNQVVLSLNASGRLSERLSAEEIALLSFKPLSNEEVERLMNAPPSERNTKHYPLFTKERAQTLSDNILKKLNNSYVSFVEKSPCIRRQLPQMILRHKEIPIAKGSKMQQLKPFEDEAQKQLDQGHSLMIGLWVPQPNGEGFGPHAIVVTNYRTHCCAGVCHTEYQLLDSLGFYWAKGKEFNGWVDEDKFIESIYSPYSYVPLSWFESKKKKSDDISVTTPGYAYDMRNVE